MNDHIIPLSAKSLADMDNGRFGLAIDKEIEMAIKDIADRPANYEGKAETRKVTITLEFTPECEFDAATQMNHLKSIQTVPSVFGKIPKRKGTQTDVRVVRGKPHFNRDAPDSFHQESFNFEGAEE